MAPPQGRRLASSSGAGRQALRRRPRAWLPGVAPTRPAWVPQAPRRVDPPAPRRAVPPWSSPARGAERCRACKPTAWLPQRRTPRWRAQRPRIPALHSAPRLSRPRLRPARPLRRPCHLAVRPARPARVGSPAPWPPRRPGCPASSSWPPMPLVVRAGQGSRCHPWSAASLLPVLRCRGALPARGSRRPARSCNRRASAAPRRSGRKCRGPCRFCRCRAGFARAEAPRHWHAGCDAPRRPDRRAPCPCSDP